MELKVLSFNIRCANDKNGHTIAERSPRLAAVLAGNGADVIGLQEYHTRWDPHWEQTRPAGYTQQMVDRGDGEGLVLLWRTERFEAVKTGNFWFADDPNTPDTTWDEKYHKPRICAYAVLRDRATGEIFTYMNVHYGFGAEGHRKNAELLKACAQKLGSYPVVIAGDFNMRPGTPGYEAMARHFTDANIADCRDITFHAYGDRERFCILDYCFVSDHVTPKSYRVVTDMFESKYPSDHYGIEMKLEISTVGD